jgi:hypothetical protein
MLRVRSSPPDAPFPPGLSPFQVKGTLWMGFRAYVDEHVVGGSTRLGEHLSPACREFFAQLFVAPGWYDLFPMLEISRAMALQRGLTAFEQARQTGTWHGEQDLKGIYKTLLKQATPQAICRRYPSLYSQLYNFGKVEVTIDDGGVKSCVAGMPEALADWWMPATEGYLAPILAAAGARQAKTIWRAMIPDGESHGLRLVRVPSETTWL